METIEQIKEDPGYFAKRSGLYVTAKVLIHPVAENIVVPLSESILPLGAFASDAVGGAAGLATIGLVAGLSAGLTQMDYNRKITRLVDIDYAEELSSKFKKPASRLTANDLHEAAKESRVIGEKIDQVKMQRNFGVFFSFASSLAAMGIVALIVAQVPALAPLAKASITHLAEWPAALLKGLMAGAAYYAVKFPLHWVGDQILGLTDETAHDRIVSLRREREAGKVISREQVLSVFAKANPQLDSFIAVNYGDVFDKLDNAGKQRAVAELSNVMPLQSLTDDINTGKINVTELAFAVEGKISGVEHVGGEAPHEKPLWKLVRRVLHFKPHAQGEMGSVAMQAPETSVAMAYAEEKTGRSFAERVGRKPSVVSYVERLDQQATLPVSQTIH